MFEEPFNIAILLIVFNRPDTTTIVLDQIRKIQPRLLFVASDGPRAEKPGEDGICGEVRNIVKNGIDWNCTVKTLFRHQNLGCGRAVSEAITWFFENVEEGIILEDDTVPDTSFFNYCKILLNRYRENEKIMHISGCYFLNRFTNETRQTESYYFSKHIHVWGWATWKRAWNYYDFSMRKFTGDQKQLQKYYGNYFQFWYELYKQTHEKKIDTWDYQWMYAIFLNSGIAINPTVNLIKNIGFNENATHTQDTTSPYSSIPTSSICISNEPIKIKIDRRRDKFFYENYLITKANRVSNPKKFLFNVIKRIKRRFLKNSQSDLSKSEIIKLKSSPRFKTTETMFRGKKIEIVDSATFLSSYYEIFEQEIYKFTSINDDPVIIDCGANIGLATLYFKLSYPGAHIFSYEADPNIFSALKKNIKSFSFNKIELYNEAIGDKEGTMLFKLEGGHSGMLVSDPGKDVINITVVPLKEVLNKFNTIDFLKIDIEGYEIKVLPSIAEELKKVQTLFLEYHTFINQPQRLSEVITIIENAGFRYYIKEAANKKNPFIERELFYNMDMLINIFCYR